MSVFGRASMSLERIRLPEAIAFEENIRLSGIALSWVTLKFILFLVTLGHSPSPLHMGPASSFIDVSPRA